MSRLAKLSDGFDLNGGRLGVLVIHGFTGSPDGLLFLGQRLHAHGWTVRVPCLPGHGTSLDELDRTSAEDWFAAVTGEFDRLAARCEQVAVVGQSLGGLLSLWLSTQRPACAVASLAAPLWLDGLGAKMMRWVAPGGFLHGRLRRLPKLGGPDARDPIAKRADGTYAAISVPGMVQLGRVMAAANACLPQLRAPLLVIHAENDHTAPVACAHHLAEHGRAEQLVILPKSFHLIASDVERDLVASTCAQFLARHFPAA